MQSILKIALNEQGVKEIPGQENNPRILQYFKDINHSWVETEETAWCSAFINWCAKMASLDRSKKLNARSWLNVGMNVEKGKQQPGDICILWRGKPESWMGHVALFVGEDALYYYLLGGNQGNAVKISAYAKTRLLGFRRLS